jgi:hypothetical protein
MKIYLNIVLQSRSVAGINRRNVVQNIDELVDERLAFNADQEVFKIVIREIGRSARIAPELDRGYVCFFLSHINVGLDHIKNGYRNHVRITMARKTVPIPPLVRSSIYMTDRWIEFVAAGFQPAFKFKQKLFWWLNAGWKPAATGMTRDESAKYVNTRTKEGNVVVAVNANAVTQAGMGLQSRLPAFSFASSCNFLELGCRHKNASQ